MILEKKQFDDGSQFALWQITEDPDTLLDMLDNDPFVIEQISHFTSIKRKCEYLAARCALNELLGKKVSVAYLPTGRPVIENSDINLSISHTGEWVVVLTHPTKRVGIDIERVTDRLLRVKNKFLNDQEISFIDFQCEKPQLAVMWATKEALYKLIDLESVDAQEHLHIEPFMTYLDGHLTAYETKTKLHRHFTCEYLVRPQYVMVRTIDNK